MGDIGPGLEVPMLVDMIPEICKEKAKVVDVAANSHIYSVDRCGALVVFGYITYTISQPYSPLQFSATD